MHISDRTNAIGLMIRFEHPEKIHEYIEYRRDVDWETVAERIRERIRANCQDKQVYNPMDQYLVEQGFRKWCGYYITQEDVDKILKPEYSKVSGRGLMGVPGYLDIESDTD